MYVEMESDPLCSHAEIIEKYRFLPGDFRCASRKYEILPDGYFDLAFLLQ